MDQQFTKGQRIRLTLTGETGTVTGIQHDGLVQVRLDGLDFSVPVASGHIEHESGGGKAETSQKAGLTGLLLVFLPQEEATSPHGGWQINLVNANPAGCLYQLRWLIDGVPAVQHSGQLRGGEVARLPFLSWTDLNCNPRVEVSCWPIKDKGSGSGQERTLRIRPSMLLGSKSVIDSLNCEAPAVVIFSSLEKPVKKSSGGSLKDYTREHAGSLQKDPVRKVSLRNPEALAAFNPELDLHIEALTDRHARMSGSEKLHYQLSRFDQWLDKAIRLGVPRLFVIHGLGKGRLREEIFARLQSHPHVLHYRNEYHHRYSFGATEILLD